MTTTMSPETEPVTTETKAPEESDLFEDIKVEGEQLLAEVKRLLHEGNVRKVIIKNSDGAVIMEVPLALGLAGAVLLPTLAAVGAIAALVTECSITVVRRNEKPAEAKEV
jgi:hypothetical protein